MARNTYPGACYVCGLTVKPMTGHFDKRPGDRRWSVKHANFPGDGRVTCELARAAKAVRETQARIFTEFLEGRS